MINIFLNEKTFMCGFKFLEASYLLIYLFLNIFLDEKSFMYGFKFLDASYLLNFT